MMQIVELGYVVVYIAERIEREYVAAMIADSLDSSKRCENHTLADR